VEWFDGRTTATRIPRVAEQEQEGLDRKDENRLCFKTFLV
jgi:hypothetical protein